MSQMAFERTTRVELPCQGGEVAFDAPEFPPVGGEAQAVRIVVSVAGLTFRSIASTHGDGYRLEDYFADLEQSWRGWEDEKQWYDEAVRIVLRAVHDGRGHVTLTVHCRTDTAETVPPYPLRAGHWKADAAVVLEAGQLASLAYAIQRLLSADNHPSRVDA